jgi:hypothetical protein
MKIRADNTKKIERIAKKHTLTPEAVLNKILDDYVDAYIGYCTITCALCHMRDEEKDTHAGK